MRHREILEYMIDYFIEIYCSLENASLNGTLKSKLHTTSVFNKTVGKHNRTKNISFQSGLQLFWGEILNALSALKIVVTLLLWSFVEIDQYIIHTVLAYNQFN